MRKPDAPAPKAPPDPVSTDGLPSDVVERLVALKEKVSELTGTYPITVRIVDEKTKKTTFLQRTRPKRTHLRVVMPAKDVVRVYLDRLEPADSTIMAVAFEGAACAALAQKVDRCQRSWESFFEEYCSG